MRCVVHILNLVVQDGIKKVDKLVEIIRWAVKWIRQSPSRISKFTKFAKLVNPSTTKHLVRDVPTRWNSTYRMLNIAQAYEKTFERYNLKEYEFRSDIEKAGLSIPSPSDWQHIRHLCHFLKPFCDVPERISGTLYLTSNTCIEDIYSILTLLDDVISDASLCDIALAMRVKFDKYFDDVEKINLLLYFSLILDPRNKVKYLVILLEDRYRKEKMEEKKKYIMDSMYKLYNDYIRIHSPSTTSSTTVSSNSSSILGKRQNPDATTPKPPLRNKLRENMKTNIVESIGELEKYLKESVEEDSSTFNILDWWKVNSKRFPNLSLMAKDLFGIPVSTVASESVFSTSRRVLDPYRSSLTPKIVESIICTQDWLRGGISDNIDF
ncbi:zinc finger BED domain-containing protein RICESLEEPER 2-like [Lactuca sativa]|uniref:zinc finger BED domain-containing protein RICESLEEPER 2-like n=1 Tax=Lactuca sativa TaxID=4236 RepID=UPI000CD878BD|nr:zinc finger BED domain-containing protein RICESLEEPER 2-like [Lactuca sativa]